MELLDQREGINANQDLIAHPTFDGDNPSQINPQKEIKYIIYGTTRAMYSLAERMGILVSLRVGIHTNKREPGQV